MKIFNTGARVNAAGLCLAPGVNTLNKADIKKWKKALKIPAFETIVAKKRLFEMQDKKSKQILEDEAEAKAAVKAKADADAKKIEDDKIKAEAKAAEAKAAEAKAAEAKAADAKAADAKAADAKAAKAKAKEDKKPKK